MAKFSVNQVAKMTGVSVRALHHYDKIGLLKPSLRAESRYRYYGDAEMLRLQQILFYKELDISLSQIAEILDDPDFDMLKALYSHKEALKHRKERLDQLIATIDKTIVQLNNKKMNYEDMYKGFSKEQAEAYEKEARERWGNDIVNDSIKRVKDMDKEEFGVIMQESENINKEMAALMHLSIENVQIQDLIKRHYAWVNHFWTVTPEAYKGLAQMYVDDERFKANYEKHKVGLAEFMSKAMIYFSERL